MGEESELEGGTLYVVATPIGNMEDVTLRALRVLRGCDALAAEDTRRTRQLLTRYDIPRPRTLLSLHEHNEEHSAQRVVGLLTGGARVALCSDAGTPLVSDPGYRAVKLVVESGFPVVAIPGPSAAIAALSISTLPPSSFTFKGFPPRKPGPRKRFFEQEAEQPHTLVVYESPHRLARMLADALEVLGDREACVCIDLTKKFEAAHRGPLSMLAGQFEGVTVRGEVTVVIEGATRR
ncbi:MAG: rRNA (cytidine1402-2-O)-methyltransferase [Thermoleophilaceae bacterium]|jgi:16S rRNA (cytidine1402-2'-O)-methyltransferase|nr:rRNA (cytidine1402-2-O)-methyltransferase [Thermoleophilaceae bacterium]MEA2470683.1 rRNA (cytidine1402-2-O)-methyltransferase [Thermoleophilaceae bacterium]